MSVNEVPAEAPATRRELAVARALDSARSRAENRVELFLDAARELMNTNATDFTVQEVVERSGQSLRTFYQYFAGKYELLLALFEESIAGAAAHLETVIAEHDDPLERLHRVLRRVLPHVPPQRAPGSRPTGPAPALVEFAQQLLTSHPDEAAHAFEPIVELLEPPPRRGRGRGRCSARTRPATDRRRRAAGHDVQRVRVDDQRVAARATATRCSGTSSCTASRT